jgi:MFS family permease
MQNYSIDTPWLGRGGFAASKLGTTQRRPSIWTPGSGVRLDSSVAVAADDVGKTEYGIMGGDLVLRSLRVHTRSLSVARQDAAREHQMYLDYLKDNVIIDNPAAEVTSSRKLDIVLFLTYACNTFALTLPVMLMPLVAAEHSLVMGPKFMAGMFIAATASISSLGGGMGKVVNGFVCQRMGARKSAFLYFLGMGVFSFLLSINTSAAAVGWILAGVEFCASMQWTAHLILLVNHYENSPIRFAAGMTVLSMASAFGILLAKIGGPTLLHYVSWRTLARFGACVAVMGGFLAQSLVTEWPGGIAPLPCVTGEGNGKKKSSDLLGTFRHVLGSRLFWQAGVAHALTCMARTSEKVLGTFFKDTTALSGSLCGGLTAFLTLGFLHGLLKGKQFNALQDTPSKSRMLRRAYTVSVVSTIGMALCANNWLTDLLIPSKAVLAAVAALLSAIMASSLSVQYYQIPTIISKTFGENKAVCLSLMDALGFFLSAPYLASTGQVVGRLGDYGWSAALTMLAVLFGVSGFLMLDIFPRALEALEDVELCATE